MQNREKKMKIATLDIGGTSIKAGEFQEGKLAEVREYDTDAKLGGDHVIKKAIEILEGFPEIDRIGISTAGQVDSKAGKIRYANSNIPGYTGMEIKKILEEKFKVPVAVENDVNAAARRSRFWSRKRYFSFSMSDLWNRSGRSYCNR